MAKPFIANNPAAIAAFKRSLDRQMAFNAMCKKIQTIVGASAFDVMNLPHGHMRAKFLFDERGYHWINFDPSYVEKSPDYACVCSHANKELREKAKLIVTTYLLAI